MGVLGFLGKPRVFKPIFLALQTASK